MLERVARRIIEVSLRHLTPPALCLLMGTLRLVAGGATLAGTVTDPQGRAVPGVIVSIQRHADSSRQDTKTGEQGQFDFSAIEPGEYRLTVESAGFPIVTRTL